MSHVTHMNESCHTYEWVMSHIWMSHVTHMNESCHTYGWVMSHINLIRNINVHATRMSHVTHCGSHVTHMSHVCVSDLSFSCIDMRLCDMTHSHLSYVCHEVMSHMWMSHVTHPHINSHLSYVCHDSFISIPWLIRKRKCHTYEWVMAHIWMSHGVHMNESWHTYERFKTCVTLLTRHTYDRCTMSHVRMMHVTHIIESCSRFSFRNCASSARPMACSSVSLYQVCFK